MTKEQSQSMYQTGLNLSMLKFPTQNIKYCSHLIVKDDSGRRLFEAVNPSNVMIIDGNYGSSKP